MAVTIQEGTPPPTFRYDNDDPYKACLNCVHYRIREVNGAYRAAEHTCARHKLKFKHWRNFLEYEKVTCASQRQCARD